MKTRFLPKNSNAALSWLLLVLSLPSDGATARIRIWRSLKVLGCAALRDGAYLLPSESEYLVALTELARECEREGGSATVLNVAPVDQEESASFTSLFDRSAEFAAMMKHWHALALGLATSGQAELIRLRRKCQREYEALQAIDYFPGDAGLDAQAAWDSFNQAIERVLSPDEPQAVEMPLQRLNVSQFQKKQWATRRRLWIDRVASAWLIQRFVDPQASFLWIEKPAHLPPNAVGFDFDGAQFTHTGERVTFETLMVSFALDEDLALARMAVLVRALDAGSSALVPEAIGLEAVLTGARERLADDDALLAEMSATFDSLYAHFDKQLGPSRVQTRGRNKSPRS